MPKFRPRVAIRMIDASISTTEMAKNWRRYLSMLMRILMSMTLSSNAQAGRRRLAGTSVNQLKNGTRADDRREHGSADTDDQRHSKTLYCTRAHGQQHDAGNDSGQVGIHNGDESTVITMLQCADGLHAITNGVFDLLVDQHV